ncbi:lipid II flippase MurJ [Streptomyces sp. 4N509B]|uniref:lipid II flippase MurJ n=1 Tax=Streptomyces sp. 4N509B TaxID=3457413 RepID=UPI003FD1E50D
MTAVLTACGALCGLARDQIIAHLFGADGQTDAFLVAWTVPEVASTLLIEDAMALLLVPAVSVALLSGPGAVRRLLAATLPRLLLGLVLAAVAVAVAAGPLVRVLAPGLADHHHEVAVDCTRLTAVTVLGFGLAGYASAVLRAHRCFAAPASIYLAYNLGVIAVALALADAWGVRAAAAGVAVGSVLMVLLQLPFVLWRLRRSPAQARAGTAAPRTGGEGGVLRREGDGPSREGGEAREAAPLLVGGLAVVAPVVLFALTRQAQVLVERCLGSSLPPGAISHLNYAQKVAQVPMVLSLMVCTVTLPMVARALAEGDLGRVRRRVERDLEFAGVVVLTGAAFVTACAPQIIEVLFERGAFDTEATEATAAVMRVYALGLLGHTLVGTLARPFFAARPVSWFPLAGMGAGLAVTAVAGFAAVRFAGWGAPGLAAANAAGISLAAYLLLRRMRTRLGGRESEREGEADGDGGGDDGGPGVDGAARARLWWLALAAVVATAAGWALAGLVPSAPGGCVVGGVVVLAVFAVFAVAHTALRRRGLPTAPTRPSTRPAPHAARSASPHDLDVDLDPRTPRP